MASVEIDSVKKRFGATNVIHGIDIHIRDGEFAILVGPSGCGKSTLLRMIAGLEPISDGMISIGGRIVNDLAPKERDIAMVFQNYALYPHMTVAENMSFSLRLRRAEKTVVDAKVGRAAKILGLESLLDRYPRQLSGGQRQRVAMGRAIVRDPKVFLFDEPLSNLDAKLRVQMRTEIRALHQKLETTIVYVTHDQIEAMTMADKIIVLDAGRVAQIGAPLDLYDQPKSRFVATFIGSPSMNILPAEAVGGGQLRLADGQVVAIENAPEPGRPVLLGVRPEHFSIGGADGGIRATAKVIEPTGAETYVVFDLGDSELVVALRDRVTLKPGETVRLAIAPGRHHLFCADTELAL